MYGAGRVNNNLTHCFTSTVIKMSNLIRPEGQYNGTSNSAQTRYSQNLTFTTP